MYYIGTAGWSIPSFLKQEFSPGTDATVLDTHLKRYSQIFNCVEVNSSFYRHHKWQTYSKWADTVPDDFLFSVKLSKELTHEQKLQNSLSDLKEILSGPLSLEEKWGVLLIQLAPKHAFSEKIARDFFSNIRKLYFGYIAFEPRNLTWLAKEAIEIFSDYGISLTYADPAPLGQLDNFYYELGGIRYSRLHGSPVIYKSRYELDALESYLDQSKNTEIPKWFIFDNTTFGFATQNAMELKNLIPSTNEAAPELQI